ncbi:MAG: hypothetical protein JW822_10605 [Spirochaetales bacterium]|nr:hypothetical protein [Spirochaetales bacterium]
MKDIKKTKQKKSLAKAKRLFQGKNFKAVIDYLEPLIFKYRESFSFYYMLGTSCLYQGDFGGALSYLRRAHQLQDEHVGTLLGLAAANLKKRDAEQALKHWLRVAELDAHNKKAQRGLELLKKGMSEDHIAAFIDSGRLQKLFPQVKKSFPFYIFLIAAGVALLIMTVYVVGDYLLSYTPATRSEVEKVTITPSHAPLIEYSGDFRYTYSEQEVSDIFKQAKQYFLRYRDNLAVVECNRLINSNAVFGIKEKAKILKGYAIKPAFTDFKDGFSFEEVFSEPLLYDGCYVMWKGKVTNLTVGEDNISFDFLVGYHEEKEFKGVVPVEVDFAANIENGFAMELLAEVLVHDTYISLKVASLRKLIPGM